MRSRKQTIKRWIIIAGGTLLLLLTGIATVLWSESKQRHAQSSQQRQLQNNLQSLVIQRPGKTDISLFAKGDIWQIHEPCVLNTNPNRLQPLLSIATPAAFSYDATEVDLDAAGLLQPLATVIANDHRIDIGSADLSGERRYAKRADRVEFVPEWILPLLDGGLSALATLELFEDAVSSVTIEKLADTQTTLTDDTAHWQQLSAQQIVPWPTPDNATLEAQHTVAITSASGEKRLQVFTTPAYAALVFEGAQCAYLLPNDALSPPSL